MVKPKYCFWYKEEGIVMKKNVPVTLESEEEVNRLVNNGLVERYEEVHPAGNLNITTNGEFDVKQYAQVTVNTEAIVVSLIGGQNYDETYYMALVKGMTGSLPNAEQYAEKWTIEEGMQLAGWTTVQGDASTKVNDEITPAENIKLYALLEQIPQEEEENIDE